MNLAPWRLDIRFMILRGNHTFQTKSLKMHYFLI